MSPLFERHLGSCDATASGINMDVALNQYYKTLIFDGNLSLAILAIKTMSAKIHLSQYLIFNTLT